MRIGKIIAMPDHYSSFGRIVDGRGVGYTIEPGDIPEDAEEGDNYAFRVEIWGNDSGLAYDLEED